MSANRVSRVVISLLLAAALAAPALAQSLNPKTPTPMRPGDNRGTIDNQVGPQFWSFRNKAGKGAIHVRFTSMGIFGNPMAATMLVVMHSATGKVVAQSALTSQGKVASLDWPGTFATPGVTVLELRPSGSNLVRNGGDYAISVDGPAADFGGPAQAANPAEIAGTYAVMVCPPDFTCDSSLAIRFAPNGTVATTDGHHGTWTVFDPDARIYSVVVGRDRWSLKLVPGRGLFNTNDLSVVVFQAVR